jgi:hypothetical protein
MEVAENTVTDIKKSNILVKENMNTRCWNMEVQHNKLKNKASYKTCWTTKMGIKRNLGKCQASWISALHNLLIVHLAKFYRYPPFTTVTYNRILIRLVFQLPNPPHFCSIWQLQQSFINDEMDMDE